MGIESLIVLLLVGAVAGWLAGQIVKGGGFGLVGNIVIGIVGAVVAGFVLPRIGVSMGGGLIASIVHATLGAVILLVLIRVIRKA
ncbi:MAG: GlsB/YeaQ/YmgE family stress response membrane protein [Paracoccaceae bacterium]|nr:GlsB/YeaQ/YmgE family stress response membrane protein [Paracoccaceae bacterium]